MNKFETFYKKKLIHIILKINKFIGKMKLLPEKTDSYSYVGLNDLFKNLNSPRIEIHLHEQDINDKDYIFDVIEILGQYGVQVRLTELDEVFSNTDYKTISEKNPNTEIDIKYMYPNYFVGSNVGTNMNIEVYLEVLEKIKFLVNVTQSNFKQKDEQVMFIVNQLAEYMKYDQDARNKNNDELNKLSMLKNVLSGEPTVCAGVALPFERCMHELGVESILIIGRTGSDKSLMDHIWVKIKLFDKWYNVDVTWLLENPESNYTREFFAECCILTSDKTIGEKNHFVSDWTGIPLSNEDYPTRMDLYNKTKDFGNVLEEYDKGNRRIILSYRNKVMIDSNISVKQSEMNNNRSCEPSTTDNQHGQK